MGLKPLSGVEIKAARKALGWTQRQLGERARIDVRVISAYENNKRLPRTKNRERLRAALGLYEDMATLLRSAERGPDLEIPASVARLEMRSILHGELAQLIGARDADLIVTWTDKGGGLTAIAEGDDKRLLALRSRVTAASVEDLLALRALVDHLIEQLRAPAP